MKLRFTLIPNIHTRGHQYVQKEVGVPGPVDVRPPDRNIRSRDKDLLPRYLECELLESYPNLRSYSKTRMVYGRHS